MHLHSQSVAADAIEDIIGSVWSGVAIETISKKLALKASHLQILEFIGSYISNSTGNRETRVQMSCQKDPISIQIDNMAYGQLQKQTKPNNNAVRKDSLHESVNQTRSRRFTVMSFNKEKSVSDANKEDNNQGLITLPEVEDPHSVQDPQQDSCRNRRFKNQEEEVQMKKMVLNRQKEREENGVKNSKMFKDLKKYTYDFDGRFFSVGQAESNHPKISKIEKENGQQSIIRKQSRNPEAKNINNEKSKQKDGKMNREYSRNEKNIPEFNQNRPESLLDMFEEGEKIQQGIKIIGEKGNQKVVKEQPRRKLSGMRKYRLQQFQNIVKDRKFKKLTSQYSSTTIDPNKTAPLNDYNPETKAKDNLTQKPYLSSNSELSLTIKKQETISVLPPIQNAHMKKSNKIGIRRLSVGVQQSSRSLLSESGMVSKRSKKSQIKIGHEELYLQNFTIGSYAK